MSFLKKLKDVTGDLAEGTKRGAQRGKFELEVRRVEGKIGDEKNALGLTLFPLLLDGRLTVENADVTAAMAKIATLSDELASKRKEIEDLGDDDSAAVKVEEPAESAAAG